MSLERKTEYTQAVQFSVYSIKIIDSLLLLLLSHFCHYYPSLLGNNYTLSLLLSINCIH